jgi:glycosyltransferase involved in cell wall biosynthesis
VTTSGRPSTDAALAASDVVAPRVCVLWTRLSGYLSSSLHALADRAGDLLVVYERSADDAPFDDAALTKGFRAVGWTGAPDERELAALVADFAPDALVVNSWHVGAYRRMARRMRGRTLRIVTVHNQWTATPKQRFARLAAPVLLRPTYDAAFVCDERQAVFAERLGFTADRMLWGINTCDEPRFAEVAAARGDALPPPAFLFVGRLVQDKGVDVLADAYRRYRGVVRDPWPLLVAGVGPEGDRLASLAGVEMLGFVQPEALPAVFARVGSLVLPSRVEPWGVVVHEAVSAGLPVVCTRACGASTRLVLDGYNGAVVASGEADGLVRALARIAGATDAERRAMTEASRSLARQYTPARWAHHLLSRIPELRAQIGLPSSSTSVTVTA